MAFMGLDTVDPERAGLSLLVGLIGAGSAEALGAVAWPSANRLYL